MTTDEAQILIAKLASKIKNINSKVSLTKEESAIYDSAKKDIVNYIGSLREELVEANKKLSTFGIKS